LLLSNALRGVGAPFGGARVIEFIPPVAGGHARANILDLSDEVLDAISRQETYAALAPSDVVLPWTAISESEHAGVLTAGQLKGLVYQGAGVWRLPEGQAFRLLADQHICAQPGLTDTAAFLDCLQGTGEPGSEAHSLVTLDRAGQFDAICDIVTYVAPALDIAVREPQHPAVQSYLEGPLAGTTILSCRNRLTEELMQFDLPSLLGVRDRGKGIFELQGQRFGVVALRPVKPERVRKSRHGFALPRIEFRPPCTTVH